jgi:hypothetical protein
MTQRLGIRGEAVSKGFFTKNIAKGHPGRRLGDHADWFNR